MVFLFSLRGILRDVPTSANIFMLESAILETLVTAPPLVLCFLFVSSVLLSPYGLATSPLWSLSSKPQFCFHRSESCPWEHPSFIALSLCQSTKFFTELVKNIHFHWLRVLLHGQHTLTIASTWPSIAFSKGSS